VTHNADDCYFSRIWSGLKKLRVTKLHLAELFFSKLDSSAEPIRSVKELTINDDFRRHENKNFLDPLQVI
jgi:hypothetical protein